MSESDRAVFANPKNEDVTPISVVNFFEWARRTEACATSAWSPLIISTYRIRWLRGLSFRLLRRIEGGDLNSMTMRRILYHFHGVTVGRYSYGDCLLPGILPPGSVVGNYCSMAEGLRVFRRNHPVSHLSQHPFFYNKELGLLGTDTIHKITDNPLHIGHDVWIGARVTILPSCRRIGDGAIVGAGAIVTRDIEPFTINVGNPARCIGQRFSMENQQRVEKSQWWQLPLSKLEKALPLLIAPVTEKGLDEFLAALER